MCFVLACFQMGLEKSPFIHSTLSLSLSVIRLPTSLFSLLALNANSKGAVLGVLGPHPNWGQLWPSGSARPSMAWWEVGRDDGTSPVLGSPEPP